jgi:hypothetical protein
MNATNMMEESIIDFPVATYFSYNIQSCTYEAMTQDDHHGSLEFIHCDPVDLYVGSEGLIHQAA